MPLNVQGGIIIPICGRDIHHATLGRGILNKSSLHCRCSQKDVSALDSGIDFNNTIDLC